ncbi:MAG: right-handed parallel beta-helix repeat-containing protein, partial [Deltaproteobacteria bacterium]|nr:right-handed parallel beta-helix repeat-containing protein [Deltaproteobacteria bacterium]
LLPGQGAAPNLFGEGLLGTEQGAGILVLAQDGAFDATASRIDGFTILNADVGGGIMVNGYAHNLEISNNLVTQNSGALHGGIRVGTPLLPTTGDGPFAYNTGVTIHHNLITRNGAIGEQGAGGGVSLNTGSDDYTVSENFICGNFTSGDGAGIGHLGLSDNGTIASNDILFNQSFNPGFTRSGGGIYVGGEAPAPPFLSLGAGTVTIEGNRIQGNQAGAGHGGGIRAEYFNGRDVELNEPAAALWYRLNITNNMIVDNVAGWSGGGISLQDVAKGNIIHNTIAHNDSTATVGALIDGVTNTSTPQPAGISSAPHSAGLGVLIPGNADFSHPTLTHNVIWQNRAFSYDASGATARLVPVLAPAAVGECAEGATFWDLGVLGGVDVLRPEWSIVTDVTGLSQTNRAWDPEFIDGYCNGTRELGELAPMGVAQAFGEGGNFVDLRYGPLTQGAWDYHLGAASPAIDYHPTGQGGGWPPHTFVTVDIDDDPRGTRVDVGADEVVE